MDPLQPVLIGVGQVNISEGDAPEPAKLIGDAVLRAAAQCGEPILQAIESVRIVNLLSRRYPDPGRLVAERLKLDVGHTCYTTAGGQTPHQLVNRACDDISTGRFDAIVIAGGESWRTRERLRKHNEPAHWSKQSLNSRPNDVFGSPLEMTNLREASLGFTDPIHAYPMFEQALRIRHGRTLEQQMAVASGIWERFSSVAVRNPYAAIPRFHTASEICRVGPANRLVGYPYTKLMNSNNSVDQAAALILCSAGKARSLGIPKDLWVFLNGAGEGSDVQFLSDRQSLAESPAIAAAGRAAFQLSGIGLDDVSLVDLYSCFPSAVQIAAEALGMEVDRELSVTGGMTFAGGPWNSYVLHSIATMATRLREEPESFGLVSANGGLLTKHVIGIWSGRPPIRGTRWRSVQPELEHTVQRRPTLPSIDGLVTLETFSVLHGRDGRPRCAWAFALDLNGHRTLAFSDDFETLHSMEAEDLIGSKLRVREGVIVGLE